MNDDESAARDELHGQFGRLFGDVFGVRESSDVRVEVCVPAHEAREGLQRSLVFVRRAICVACAGTGRDPASPPCPRCGGKREVSAPGAEAGSFVVSRCAECDGHGHDERFDCTACERGFVGVDDTAEIVFPPDADTGTVVRVAGKGHARGEGERGDLLVVLTIDESRTSGEGTDRGESPRTETRVKKLSAPPPRQVFWNMPRIVVALLALASIAYIAKSYLFP